MAEPAMIWERGPRSLGNDANSLSHRCASNQLEREPKSD